MQWVVSVTGWDSVKTFLSGHNKGADWMAAACSAAPWIMSEPKNVVFCCAPSKLLPSSPHWTLIPLFAFVVLSLALLLRLTRPAGRGHSGVHVYFGQFGHFNHFELRFFPIFFRNTMNPVFKSKWFSRCLSSDPSLEHCYNMWNVDGLLLSHWPLCGGC